MTLHSVNRADLEAALASAQSEATQILDQVNFAQNELAKTSFVGEQAESLKEEMNAKMSGFVATSYENVNELMRVIVNNMNVVVTKLGGALWEVTTITPGQVTNADVMRVSANQDYEIDTDEMLGFAGKVDEWFEAIVSSYQAVESTIADGTPTWQGPEKVATVSAVREAVGSILGSAGGTGVRGVGSSLSSLLRDQVSVMESGA